MVLIHLLARPQPESDTGRLGYDDEDGEGRDSDCDQDRDAGRPAETGSGGRVQTLNSVMFFAMVMFVLVMWYIRIMLEVNL